MLRKILVKKTDAYYAENRLLKFAFVFLCLGLVGMGIYVHKAVQYKTVVVIPPNMESSATFVNGIPNDEFIEKITRDIVGLAFNYTPATVRSQFGQLLTYVAPEEFASESRHWYELANKIEAARVSSTMPLDPGIDVNPSTGEIKIRGSRTQYTNDQLIETKKRVYIIKYTIRRGRFCLQSIMETKA